MKIKAKTTSAHEGIWVTVIDGCGTFDMPLHQAALMVKDQGLKFNQSLGEWR